MAPEQAKGGAADKRSDVWAFGCVLYEMLTGRRAFEGEDVSDTLAAVLRSEPDWTALPDDAPPAIVELIKRSLEKNRRHRIADLAAAVFVLTSLSAVSATGRQARANAVTRHPITAAAAVVAAIVSVAAIGWWLGARSRPREPEAVTRFAVSMGERVTTPWRLVALSPDGKTLAYVANSRVHLRPLDRLEATPVRGTESSGGRNSPGSRNPVFSPDGQWIAFWLDGQIKKVGITGGAAVVIAPARTTTSITWEDDGTILFTEGGNVLRVSEAGGKPEVIVGDSSGLVQSPHLLPGTRSILYTLFPAGMANAEPEIVVRSLDSGQQQTVIRGGVDADYLPTGHLAYYAAGTLLAVPFDRRALRVTGAPVPVAENVADSRFPGRVVVAQVAMSRSGTLAYVIGGRNSFADAGSRTLVWADRAGREETLGAPEKPYVYPRLSPDGRRVALTVRDPAREIWIFDIDRRALARLTSDPAEERHNTWTPDGKRIIFASDRAGDAAIWWQAADGTSPAERLAGFPFNRVSNFLPNGVTPDGSKLLATVNEGPGGSTLADVWIVPLIGDHQPAPLLQAPSIERNAEISPDGRWIAYESLETGRSEIYVRPFPSVTAGKWPVSTGGGSQPLWARSGKELFFVAPSGALMSVPVGGGTPLTIGPPARVFDGSFVWVLPTYAGRQYDVSSDGQRFLVMKPSSSQDQADVPTSITIVQNWTEELKQRVPTR
jgi:serine/threonine-protein kinase